MKIRTTLLLLAAASTAHAQNVPAGDLDSEFVFEVTPPVSPEQAGILLREFDLGQCIPRLGNGPFQVFVPMQQMELFTSLQLNARYLRQTGPLGGPATALTPPTGYYTTPAIIQEIDNIVATYPAIARKVDLSTLPGAALTHNGQPIWALELSDNVGTAEDEPAMVFAAQHHAREVNATYMVIGAMNRVAAGYGVDPALTAAVDNYELYFVPCVNPDGNDYVFCCNDNWRKNRRNNGTSFGVDINRNYGFLWGVCGASTSPSSDTYRGPAPNSEPETQTMRALIAELRPEVYIDFHSFGREVLFLYPPCATVNANVTTMANAYIDDLRNPMGYQTRLPSASGEAPHDHWATTGTMSLLIEVSTAFQPPFSSTVAEEAQVWPGVNRVLSTWRPSVSGHVRSTLNGQPLAADISYTPNLFNHNEKITGRARDGRYAMWLPRGLTYQVTFSAPGHQSETRSISITRYNEDISLEIELAPNGVQTPTLALSGTAQIGTTETFIYTSPGSAGDGYWVALAGSDTPGLPIGARTIPLTPDGLFSASAIPGLITNNIGTLPGSETINAGLGLPLLPGLVGTTLYVGGITLNTSYNFSVKTFSASTSFTIQP